MTDIVDRFRYLILAFLAVPLIVGLAYLALERLADDPEPLEIRASDKPSEILVYVVGAVREPGVYPLAEGSRWIDALEAAGGPAPDADLEAVSLAQRAVDEARIFVPRVESTVAGATAAPIGLVNLNTADQQALESLPGVGEVRASRIIESRQADGPFTQVEDLLLRGLVPSSVLEDVAPLVVVN